MTIEHWEISESLKKELDEHYKTAFAISLQDEDPIAIAKALTFDGLVDSFTVDDLQQLLRLLDTRFTHGGLKGIGLEIGSGPGTFVAAFATLPEVTRMYGVEACEAIVTELMTKVVKDLAGGSEDKVVGAVADFDHISLPDNSVDFIFDFFSLHHSPDPTVTLAELSRVLKPGGVMVYLDKARANSMSEAELEALLDLEYPETAKKKMGLDPEKRHTRRMNGEHEYRLKDWERYFSDAGLGHIEHYNVAKIGGTLPVRIVKTLLSICPIAVQTSVSGYISNAVTNNLEPSNRIFTNLFPAYPREFSLIISRKT